MLNNENLFLIVIGLIWIFGAVLQDLRRREVDNLWNFSLIGVALSYRLSVSIFTGNYFYFFNGVGGFLTFLFLGNLFYYSRLFAGGDAKLIIALGTVLPLSYDWLVNLKIFGVFILSFLIAGSIYALLWSMTLVIINWRKFKKEFFRQWRDYKRMFYFSIAFVVFWIFFVFLLNQSFLIFLGLIVLLFPLLFVFAKTVEESCMVRLVKPDRISEGDWLYEDVRINGKVIKNNWQGVSRNELGLIRKSSKKILIKYGIPFTPSFLFGFLILLFFIWKFF
jgi:hypothetical protein